MSLSLAALLLLQANLDPALRFRAPASCDMGGSLQAVVNAMVNFDYAANETRAPPPVAVPGLAVPLVAHFERTHPVKETPDLVQVSVSLPLRGRWHGLRVTGLVRNFVEEADDDVLEIEFADPPARVRAVLNRAGFQLPAIGRWRTIDAGEGLYMTIYRHGSGATLICSLG